MSRSEAAVRVIVNADDFGMNAHCSHAIAQAFRGGLVTDTTLMANGAYVEEAIALARANGFERRVGVHLNLTEGVPLTEGIKRCGAFVRSGRFFHWQPERQPLSPTERQAVYAELTAQVERLKRAGIAITHADSHHYIHTAQLIAPVAAAVCREQGITKVRVSRNLGVPEDGINDWLRRRGFSTTAYFTSLRYLPEAPLPGQTEIMVHPDFDRDGVLIDRRGIENGAPVGVPLPDLQRERQLVFMDYTAL